MSKTADALFEQARQALTQARDLYDAISRNPEVPDAEAINAENYAQAAQNALDYMSMADPLPASVGRVP